MNDEQSKREIQQHSHDDSGECLYCLNQNPLSVPAGSANDWKERLANIAIELRSVERQMIRGCFNHGCRIVKPTGQATNGPCQCSPRNFARALLDIAARVEQITMNK